jgi:hypothetical protein
VSNGDGVRRRARVGRRPGDAGAASRSSAGHLYARTAVAPVGAVSPTSRTDRSLRTSSRWVLARERRAARSATFHSASTRGSRSWSEIGHQPGPLFCWNCGSVMVCCSWRRHLSSQDIKRRTRECQRTRSGQPNAASRGDQTRIREPRGAVSVSDKKPRLVVRRTGPLQCHAPSVRI